MGWGTFSILYLIFLQSWMRACMHFCMIHKLIGGNKLRLRRSPVTSIKPSYTLTAMNGVKCIGSIVITRKGVECAVSCRVAKNMFILES